MESTTFGRFDQVRLLSTKNVSYLSVPSGETASPKGIWSVVATVEDGKLLLAKNNAVIKIPASDVLKIAEYDLSELISRLGKLSHGKDKRIEDRPGSSKEHNQ